jgi:hypothetical protein
MACGHQRLGASPTPDQEETNGCSLLELPAVPQHFLKSEKVAMGIDPAFDFICNRLRPYSKMLTLPMVHPVTRKLARHPWLAHVIFFNGLKFRGEFIHFPAKASSFLDRNGLKRSL